MPRLWLAMGVGVACLVASGVLVTLARAQATGDPAAVIAAYEAARNQRINRLMILRDQQSKRRFGAGFKIGYKSSIFCRDTYRAG